MDEKDNLTPETKNDKFVRVAESRTNKIIDMIRLLGNCSNKAVYDYTEDEASKIFSAIEIELKNAKSKFIGFDSKDDKFKLR